MPTTDCSRWCLAVSRGVRVGAAGLAMLLVACGADHASAPDGRSGTGNAVVRFIVTNDLEAPVTIAIDDTVSAILTRGASTGLAVAPTAQWLTWTSAKPTDSAGTVIPDDIGRVRVRVTGIRGTLEITNVIDDTTYVTAQFFNQTSARVSIGVAQGGVVSCASELYAASGGASGYTRIGYYRLLPTTEIRAYRDGTRCTGAYVAWPHSALAAFTPKSGLVTLVLDTPP